MLVIPLVLAFAAACADSRATLPPTQGGQYEVYYLGGQSNMEGYGFAQELPAELRVVDPAIIIFHGNPGPDGDTAGGLGLWSMLVPGHGVGFSSDGMTNRYSERFGMELSFARRIRELKPSAAVALVKYARASTSLDTLAAGQAGSWDPDYRGGEGLNQFDHFITTITAALRVTDVNGDGITDKLVPAGILWMQGEADGNHAVAAARYQANLERLMQHMRVQLGVADLPVVIGRISDSGRDADGQVWDHAGLVRSAQAAFVAADGNAALITSADGYDYSDPWHYNSAGYIDLGRRFADAIHELLNR